MKPAQNRPQMRKKLLQKCFVQCNRYCKITTQISIFDRFFMDVRAKGPMMWFNFFSPFRLTPAVTNNHQTLATKITKQFSVFSNFEKNEVFLSLKSTRFDVAAK